MVRGNLGMSKFFKEGFDAGTDVKLEIYQRYITSWLPTFATQKKSWKFDHIRIFDFFSGPGMDAEGNLGSPLIALQVAIQYAQLAESNGYNIYLYFSDKSRKNVRQLQERISTYNIPFNVVVDTSHGPFKHKLRERLPDTFRSANLLFIDQFGLKEMTPNVFDCIQGLKGTDLLFFISSWHAARFNQLNVVRKYIDATDYLRDSTFNDSHRNVCAYFRSLIPGSNPYYVAPFSIKKRSSVHGLIFGSSHYKGLLKFLQVCWSADPETGDSNWDIDDDRLPQAGDTLDMFKTESNKVVRFKEHLRELIELGVFQSDRSIFYHTLEMGFLPTVHAKPVLKELIDDRRIAIDGGLRMGEAVIKQPRQITLINKP